MKRQAAARSRGQVYPREDRRKTPVENTHSPAAKRAPIRPVEPTPAFQVLLSTRQKRAGAPYSFSLHTNEILFAYCYLEDGNGAIARVFPNRWQPDSVVKPQAKTAVPRAGAGFGLVLPKNDQQETLICLASDREVGRRLPSSLKGGDLEPLPISALSELERRFREGARALGGELLIERHTLRTTKSPRD